MRLQDHVVQTPKRFRNVRLVGEDIESRTAETALAKRCNERRLIDHAATRHIHQDPVTPKGIKNARIDNAPGFGTSRSGDDENLRMDREITQVHHETIWNVADWADIRVRNGHVKALGTAREGAPDAAQAQDAEPLAADLAREWQGL